MCGHRNRNIIRPENVWEKIINSRENRLMHSKCPNPLINLLCNHCHKNVEDNVCKGTTRSCPTSRVYILMKWQRTPGFSMDITNQSNQRPRRTQIRQETRQLTGGIQFLCRVPRVAQYIQNSSQIVGGGNSSDQLSHKVMKCI